MSHRHVKTLCGILVHRNYCMFKWRNELHSFRPQPCLKMLCSHLVASIGSFQLCVNQVHNFRKHPMIVVPTIAYILPENDKVSHLKPVFCFCFFKGVKSWAARFHLFLRNLSSLEREFLEGNSDKQDTQHSQIVEAQPVASHDCKKISARQPVAVQFHDYQLCSASVSVRSSALSAGVLIVYYYPIIIVAAGI